jgi:hypothetical protein
MYKTLDALSFLSMLQSLAGSRHVVPYMMKLESLEQKLHRPYSSNNSVTEQR